MPDDVQPQEGQGGEAPGIFDPYLQAVPEEARESVTSYLKDAEKQVNERIAKASELEKTLGPYQKVEALSSYEPDQLEELLGWHQQVVSSPEAYQQWLAQEAEAQGFTKAEAQAIAEDAEDDGQPSQEKIQEIIDQRLQEQLGPLQEQQKELSEARMVDSIEGEIRSEWSRLEAENKQQFSDDQKAMILDLGMQYEGDEKSWIEYGYDRFKEITAQGAKAFVAEKTGQPAQAMSTGGAEAFKPATTFKEANEQMRERLRQ